MKTSNFILLTVVAVFFAAATPSEVMATKKLPAFSKQASFFTFFRTHRQGKGITATWAMNSNTGVVGYTIQRTYEDPTDPYAYWEDLCAVPSDRGHSCSYTDEQVFPGVINYRVTALMTDGSVIVSEISSVRIVSRH